MKETVRLPWYVGFGLFAISIELAVLVGISASSSPNRIDGQASCKKIQEAAGVNTFWNPELATCTIVGHGKPVDVEL